MKHQTNQVTSCFLQGILRARMSLLFLLLLLYTSACVEKYFVRGVETDAGEKMEQQTGFLSSSYNHFEGGILFTDLEFGLTVLWQASFKNRNAYKETLGFFVPGGLLILPNRENTCNRAKLGVLPLQLIEGKLFVLYKSTHVEVLAIIHTHPDIYSEPFPAPRNDYQYGYLGIHNYVMDFHNLFDAYKDSRGRECYKRLGPRSAYSSIPFVSADRGVLATASILP